MNFEVLCFDYINDGLQCVYKEYFDTLEEAREFESIDGNYYDWVSVTPLNPKAEKQLQGA